jgi:hypothetical protein
MLERPPVEPFALPSIRTNVPLSPPKSKQEAPGVPAIRRSRSTGSSASSAGQMHKGCAYRSFSFTARFTKGSSFTSKVQ